MNKINKVTNMSYQYNTYNEMIKHSWEMLCNKWEIEQYEEENMIIHYKKNFILCWRYK